MKEIDRGRNTKTNQSKRSGRTERTTRKQNQENGRKNLKSKETESKALIARRDSSSSVSDSNTCIEHPEVYENMVVHYVDDVNRSEEVPQDIKSNKMVVAKENKDVTLDDRSSDFDVEAKHGKDEESDCETIKDSVSSQGDSFTTEDENVEKASKVPKSIASKSSSESTHQGTRVRAHQENHKTGNKASSNNQKKSAKSDKIPAKVTAKNPSDKKVNKTKVPPKPSSESSEEVNDKPIEVVEENERLDEAANGTQSIADEASNGTQSIASDNKTIDTEENGEHVDEVALNQKIEEMEMRIEKLQEELREVAALEVSLYSVAPEHGSSAHKVHTPARRLSRLYIHACKHWSQKSRATVAKNTVSGLVLVAKSCGNDVSRLTFWLSNITVLREIICQAFGSSRDKIPVTRFSESHGANKRSEGKSMTLKWKGSFARKQGNGHLQFVEDWQEMGTFTNALEKVESWIFSRIVESVWWQTLTPHMQSPALATRTLSGKLLGPALGDQQQGSFSINLWKNAFQDALQRLCPVRAGGHECGCLPVLARRVMEQCIARLDVAMFNAILRESAHEIPTDPVSDPIVDPKVLPIPAGDLSFGSGAQLKNSVGDWSRWLTDMLGMDTNNSLKEDQQSSEDDGRHDRDGEPKSFPLLNELSDLLMLPKDMIMDRSIRHEVCPSICVPLIKRILCNFTPDEFCPDPVPGAVLEALNAESIIERRLSEDSARSFPYTASPLVYDPPCDVAENVGKRGGRPQLLRNLSMIQRKGYTSDEELEELDCPLTSVIEKLPSSPKIISGGTNNVEHNNHSGYNGMNARYEILREVWSHES